MVCSEVRALAVWKQVATGKQEFSFDGHEALILTSQQTFIVHDGLSVRSGRA